MGKLSDASLIEKLVALLREDDPDKFDDAVNQLATDAKQVKRSHLEKLFDSQIATLRNRGTPDPIVRNLLEKHDVVIERDLKLWENKYPAETIESLAVKGIYLSLPVIPRSWERLDELMTMVRNYEKTGYTFLNPIDISDVVDVPQTPDYIYDVEDGSSTLDESSDNPEKTFKLKERSPLTAAEVMALATHTKVLSKHHVWAIGSRYESANQAPIMVRLNSRNRPILDWRHASRSDFRLGSASCGSR